MQQIQPVLDTLQAHNINYSMVSHAPVFTMDDMLEAGLQNHGTLVKNLFLRDAKGKRHMLVCVEANEAINLSNLAQALDSTKLSFASPDRTLTHLGVEKGAVSPLGILNNADHKVEVFLSSTLQGCDSLGVHPNDNSATIFISFADLKSLIAQAGNEVSVIKIK